MTAAVKLIIENSIAQVTFDNPQGSANIMNELFRRDFHSVIETLATRKDELKGIILQSAKSTFFAGGDLKSLIEITPDNAHETFAMTEGMKHDMRILETLGLPVVSIINGAALGGGWEVALSTHHRIAFDSPNVIIGLPEVTLGLLPGAGGITRMVRLLGIEKALPYLLEGRQLNARQAFEAGLVHHLVEHHDAAIVAAKAFIEATPESTQPWDRKAYRLPGGPVNSPKLQQLLTFAPAMLKAKTKNVFPAPKAILCAATEGAQVDFDTAARIESRYFAELASGQVAKNIIGTLWFQNNEIKAGASRPQNTAKSKCQSVGILGAGMMGAGIAYSSAIKGISVQLKDVSIEAAEKGKAYSERLLAKRVARGKMTEEKKHTILSRIHTTTDSNSLAECDLIIEAVFEDKTLKAQVTQEVETQLNSKAIFASNTSTLPISELAKASRNAEQFIGLHFFSPVDKMPLVEIIKGKHTNDETIAKSYDFVQQIGKTPIVVNDRRAFFTSRVFGTFTNEGATMLGEGIAPAAIENAAFLAGFPVGPLAVLDEVTLTLVNKVNTATAKAMHEADEAYQPNESEPVIDRMLELNRAGKSTGAGFYDYPDNAKKHLWKGLKDLFQDQKSIPLQDIKDRLLYIQAIETIRCLEEGVLESVRDANIGSIMGIGYPAWTGGAIQFVNQTGLRTFVNRAQELCERYGSRFQPPKLLLQQAETEHIFKDSEEVK